MDPPRPGPFDIGRLSRRTRSATGEAPGTFRGLGRRSLGDLLSGVSVQRDTGCGVCGPTGTVRSGLQTGRTSRRLLGASAPTETPTPRAPFVSLRQVATCLPSAPPPGCSPKTARVRTPRTPQGQLHGAARWTSNET